MKKKLLFYLCLFCAITLSANELHDTVSLIIKYDNLHFTYDEGHKPDSIYGKYTGVRVGEYYWMTQNFHHHIPINWGGPETSLPVTQQTLDKYLNRCFLDELQYQVDLDTFRTYYGRNYMYYYSHEGSMYEVNDENIQNTGWGLPINLDVQQLFAMCPFSESIPGDIGHKNLNERDVRIALGASVGTNPMSFEINDPKNGPYKTYWFNGGKNIYGIGLMPTGAQLNGEAIWYNGLGPEEMGGWKGVKGDIYHLFYTAVFSLHDGYRAVVHDYIDSEVTDMKYHYAPVRWCRKLTDEELGYKLYVNEAYTDVIKIDLNETRAVKDVPEGYIELPNGYFRGFYVQYILNKPESGVTIADIRNYTEQVQDKTFNPRQIFPEVTNLNEHKGNTRFNVYPNPASDFIKLDSEDLNINQIEILNLSGKKILSSAYNGPIDISNLPNGIYSIKVLTENNSISSKFIKR